MREPSRWPWAVGVEKSWLAARREKVGRSGRRRSVGCRRRVSRGQRPKGPLGVGERVRRVVSSYGYEPPSLTLWRLHLSDNGLEAEI